MSEVLAQLKAVLATVKDQHGDTVDKTMEWIHPEDDLAEYFPEGQPFVSVMRGNCEGFLLRIYNMHKAEIKCVISIKYFYGAEFMYKLGSIVSEALYEGGFANKTGS
jgi:hypothetical protein